ncbi:GNAT family N-acetyltransferase [Mucilaginibacter sp.]
MQLPAHQYGLIFRLVEESDAEFIFSLRTDPRLAKHISSVTNELEAQKAWIRNYKEREARRLEYYILYADQHNQPVGVVRIYDITDTAYTCGSWLIKSGCDEFISAKSDLFISKFASEELKNKRCVFDVRKNNKKALRYHKMFATIIGEDELNYYFTVNEEDARRKKSFLTSIIQPNI